MDDYIFGGLVSTHSRLKAAGTDSSIAPKYQAVSTHSRLKAAGASSSGMDTIGLFQHTAA